MSVRATTRSGFRPLHGVLLALLALPAAWSGVAGLREARAGAPPVKERYRDRVHKFSLRMFKDYKPVPLRTDEKYTVCKFRDPKEKGENRGSFPVEVEIVRVSLDGKDKPVTTGDGGVEIPPEILERLGGGEPKDVWSATVNRLWFKDEAAKKAVEAQRAEFKAIKSDDDVPGKLWQFDVAVAQSWDNEQVHVTLAEFTKDDTSFGIFMTCGERMEKAYSRAFKQIAQSFLWFDKGAKDVESLGVLDGINITARKRSEIERSMVKGWDVIVSPKQNYIIIYNTKNNTNHLLAKVIAERIEMIREQVYEVQFPPSKPITTVCIVRVCADGSEYRAYGGPGGSAGYWSSSDEELVFYDASASKKPDDDTLSVLYHEAFHQYIFYSVGNVAPHSWFNEGHGDYYAGAVLKGRKFVIKPFAWRVGTIKNALVEGPRPCSEVEDDQGHVQKQWEPKGYTPLQDLVRFSQGEYYSYPGVCYAQGWSLIYFLREVVPKNKKYNEKWGHILDTYFNTLQAEVNKEAPLERGGEGKDGKGDDGKGDDGKGGGDADGDDGKGGDGKGGGDADGGDGKGDDGTGGDGTGGGDADGEDGKGGEKKGGDTPGPDKPDGGDGDKPDDEPLDIARIFNNGRGGPEALKKAVDEAFKGVDWDEFEKAWLNATKRV